jgi:hypothetical protein
MIRPCRSTADCAPALSMARGRVRSQSRSFHRPDSSCRCPRATEPDAARWWTEALLDALEHQIADHLTGDAAGAGTPSHDFSIAGVERKGHSHHLAVPARDLEAIGGPTQVRPDRDDLTVVDAARGLAGYRCKRIPFCDIRR